MDIGDCPPPPEQNFDCGNGESVPKENVCDMVSDCSNDADETDCGSCTFEDDTCSWDNTGNTDYYWHRQEALLDCEGSECRLPDHTFGSDNSTNTTGHFMYLKKDEMEHTYLAKLTSPLINKVHSTCEFQFWY